MPILILTVPVKGVATFMIPADNEDAAIEIALNGYPPSEIEWDTFIWEDAYAEPEQPE